MMAVSPLQAEDPPTIDVQPTVREEEISFESGDVTLYGTLTTPTHYDPPHPAVLLVAGGRGSGQDGPSGLMRKIAHHLAHLGYASLRTHDRASSRYDEVLQSLEPDALRKRQDFRGFRRDVEAAYYALAFRPEVSRDVAPAMLAHYHGCLHAMEIAASVEPSALILMAPPGRPMKEVLKLDYEYLIKRFVSEPAEATAIRDNLNLVLETVEELNDLPPFVHSFLRPRFNRNTVAYYHDLLRARPLEKVSGYKRPVLVARGEDDPLTSAEDATNVAGAFSVDGENKMSLWSAPELDHIFSRTGAGPKDGERFPLDDRFLRALDDFMKRNVPRPADGFTD